MNIQTPSFRQALRAPLVAVVTAVAALAVLPGCAVTRGQSNPAEYVTDSAITGAVKSRLAAAGKVDASSISVETLNGEVMLSGFAKSDDERMAAEQQAWQVQGVQRVLNKIVVRG